MPASPGDAAGPPDAIAAGEAADDGQPSPAPAPTEAHADGPTLEGLPTRGPDVRVVDLDVQPVLVAVATMTAIVVLAAIASSGIVTTMVVLAGLFAFALDPVVDRIEHRFQVRRGYAVALLMGGVMVVVFTTIAVLGPQTVEQARSFQQDLPKVVDGLKDLPVVGPKLAENDVPRKIQLWAAKLPKQLSGDTSQITNAAETITAILLDAIGVTLIMIALLIDGPWLVLGARKLIPPGRREQAHRLGAILSRVIGRYFAGSLLLSTLQGVQVLITGLILGVPLSPLLAVWAAVWNLVPQIGGAIGGVVFVLVAFTQGATTGVIAAIVFLLYLTFANNVLLPVILGKAVNISPLATMVATIGGFAVAGIVGAMLAVPILGAGKAMYLELRHELPAEDDEAPPGPPGVVRRTIRRLRGTNADDDEPVPTPATAG